MSITLVALVIIFAATSYMHGIREVRSPGKTNLRAGNVDRVAMIESYTLTANRNLNIPSDVDDDDDALNDDDDDGLDDDDGFDDDDEEDDDDDDDDEDFMKRTLQIKRDTDDDEYYPDADDYYGD